MSPTARDMLVKNLALLTPETELRVAATCVIASRLARLRHFTEKMIASKPGDDVEAVHQIRVFCRRLEAGLDLFEEALPGKHVKRLGKCLKRLRRSAGDVRDADVLAIELRKVRDQCSHSEAVAVDHLLELHPKQRLRAVERLHKRIDKLDRRGFWDWVAKRYASKQADDALRPARSNEESLARLHERKVDAELNRFLAAFAGTEEADVERLHQLRIACKRYRYVLEVFAGCFGPTFKEAISDPIKSLQESLGALNDAYTFSQRLDRLAHLTDDEGLARSLSELRERYTRQLHDSFAQFGQTWTTEQRDEYAAVVRSHLHPDSTTQAMIPPPSPLAANL